MKLKKFWIGWGRWKLSPKTERLETAKKNAALEAAKHVKNGFVVGLGSGSTAAFAIQEIGRKIKHEKLGVLGVPTSFQAFTLAVENRIPVTTLDEHPALDVTIDGADQIDDELNLIKGMGGALTREKIVASSSKRLIIVADENKKVKSLGENNHPLPIEVVPFALKPLMNRIKEMDGIPHLREDRGKVGPVITDNGNFILDVNFGRIDKPANLETQLRRLVGVVETGLFIDMADIAFVGKTSGLIETIKRK